MRAPAPGTLAGVLFAALAAAACGSSTENRGSYTLSLSEQSASVGQGTSKSVTVTLARDRFDKPVALAIDGVPTGVAATFTPATIAGAGTTSTLQLTVAGSAAPVTSLVTVRATAEGVAEQTATLNLTITVSGDFTLSALEAPITAAQGGGGNASILVNRTGGFSGTVSLAATGAPSGMSVTFSAASTAGNSLGLTVGVAPSVATGSYPITVTGSATGVQNQTTQVVVNVITAPATSSVTVAFCAAQPPVWFAYRNEGSAWQQSTSASGASYTFEATERLGVAYTYATGGGTQVNVFYATRAELSAFTARDCTGSKNFSGTVSGMSAGQSADIAMGVASASVTAPGTTFNLNSVAARPLDLVAVRAIESASTYTPDRVIVRRNLDLATGATIPLLDFTAGESFATTPATIGVNGSIAGEQLSLYNTWWTGTSTYATLHTLPAQPSVVVQHVPAAQLASDDLHELYVGGDQPNGSAGHFLALYFTTPADRAVTFGPYLLAPTVSTVSVSPYVRMRGRIPVQPEYPSTARFGFYQEPSGGGSRLVYVALTAAYLGGTPPVEWDHVIPDFGTVAGFSTSWMLIPGSPILHISEAYAGRSILLFGARPVAGDQLLGAYRVASGAISGIRGATPPVRGVPARRQYFSR